MTNQPWQAGVFVLLLAIFGACSKTDSTAIVTQTPLAVTEAGRSVVPEDMVLIPAGEFTMGSDDIDASGKSQEFGFNEPLYLPEHPQRRIALGDYYIDKFEVSNGPFKRWLRSLGRYTEEQVIMIEQRLKLQDDQLPVRLVTWSKAQEFCFSAGKRLPTEAEWEKAARGTDAREYPWGNQWQPDYLNAGQQEQELQSVGSYPAGQSPYAVFNMAGNVMEWTADWYEAYPGADYQSPYYGHKRKVARGGSWGGVGHYVIPHYFRVAYRFNFPADAAYNDVGFRCAADVK